MKCQIVEAVRAAAELHLNLGIKKNLLNDGKTRVNPFLIASTLGVDVMLQPLDLLLGAYICESRPGILVNSTRPAGLMSMTCAHELGHFYLGHETNVDTEVGSSSGTTIVERQADEFAYSLLAPPWLIPHVSRVKGWSKDDLRSPEIVYQLSLRLGISYQATVISLMRQNHINGDLAKSCLSNVTPAVIKKNYFQGYELPESIGNKDVWMIDNSDLNLILEPKPDDIILASVENNISSGYVWSIHDSESVGFKLEHLMVPYQKRDIGKSGFDTMVGGSRNVLVRLSPNSCPIPGQPLKIGVSETRPFEPNGYGQPDKTYKTTFYSLQSGLEQSSKEKHLQRNSM